ncbi:MAG: peptidoglycan DD-metalloendopeptidase family protein [Clostridia bacterium]|nr:peptidoglycan DD-metalloendopeptidase family protein [Clostridia bacterium]
MLKKLLIHTRRSMKMLILLAIACLIIVGVVIALYHTTYSVTINGEEVGYTKNKSELQERINEYIQNGDEEKVAFVQIQNMPEYEICLLKRDIETNDDEIFEKVKAEGVKYYRYYAVLEDQEEKLYVSKFEEAEKIVNDLKEKNSQNKDKITIVEKYETELKDFITEEEAVAKLYVEPPKVIQVAKTTSSTRYASTGSVNTATTTSGGKVNLGISLIKPVSGVISSRFGVRSSIRSSAHTGLDIATSKGTPIKAAASGTVSFSGWKGSYGNLLVISHGNGVQTYYGHCSALYVSAGTAVTQGQTVAAVGSTGNSTGPHLHLEIRVNGVAYNPQNYLY